MLLEETNFLPKKSDEWRLKLYEDYEEVISDIEKLSLPDKFSNFQKDVLTAYNNFKLKDNLEYPLQKLHLASIIAIYNFGLIDCNSINIKFVDQLVLLPIPSNIFISFKDISNALLLIISTKINFFLNNHPVGKDKISGFPEQVIKLHYQDLLKINDTSKVYDSVCRVSKWASTHIVFEKFGLKRILKTSPLNQGYPLTIDKEIMDKMRLPPAGCEDLCIANNCLKRFINSPVFKYVQDEEEFKIIRKEYIKVSKCPAAYHLSAKYLTGIESIKINKKAIEKCCGRLGSFMSIFYSTSPLYQSKLFIKDSVPIFKEYEDYSEEFHVLCTIIKEGLHNKFSEMLSQNDSILNYRKYISESMNYLQEFTDSLNDEL